MSIIDVSKERFICIAFQVTSFEDAGKGISDHANF